MWVAVDIIITLAHSHIQLDLNLISLFWLFPIHSHFLIHIFTHKRALGLQSLFVESSFTQLTVDHFKFLPCHWSSGGTLLGKWWWWWDVVWAVLLAINCNLSGDSCDKLLSLIWSKITCTEVVSRAEKETSFSIFYKLYFSSVTMGGNGICESWIEFDKYEKKYSKCRI